MQVARREPCFGSVLVFIAASLAGLVACQSRISGDSEESSFREVVTYAPADYAAAPRLRLEQRRPACREEDSHCRFSKVAAGAIAPDGKVTLADHGGALREFDASGSFIREIGRAGSGRGEYRSVVGVTYDAAGGLRVLDMGNFRLLAYDSLGHQTLAVQLRPPTAFAGARLWRGGLVFFSLPAGDSVGALVGATFHAVDSSGQSSRSIVTVRAPAVAKKGTDLQPLRPFFAPRASWAVGADGSIAFVSGALPIIERFDSTGRGNLWIHAGLTPGLVSAAELAAEKQRVLETFSRDWREVGKQTVEHMAAQSPRTHPAFTAIHVLDDGTIWVRETATTLVDSVRWNAFRRSGRWLGWAVLPASTRILSGRVDRLLLAHDAKGYPPAEWVAVRAPIEQ